MNRKLQRQLDVRHLNIPAVRRTLPAYEFRPLRFLVGVRTHSLVNAQAFECALRNRDACEIFWFSSATRLHSVCPTHMAGGLARHRDLSECHAQSAVSSRVPRAGGARDVGRSQRVVRLAIVRGFCQGTDQPSANSLCRGGRGSRFGEHCLCVGLDHHQLVADVVSLGRFSPDQSGCGNPHTTRSARTNSHLYPYDQRPPARRSLARRTDLGAGSFLLYGSRLHGFSTGRSAGGGGCFHCAPRQRQSLICPPSLPTIGRSDWDAQRPNRQADPRALARRFSLAFAKSALLRCGDVTRFDLPDESSGNPRRRRGWNISAAIADRTVHPLDQRSLTHQTFFRKQPNCSESAIRDLGGDLLAGRHYLQAFGIARHFALNIATFERSPFLESAFA